MTRFFRGALVILAAWSFMGQRPAVAADYAWKAGVASTIITPGEPMWMAGYAARNKPSEGVALDLFAKAMALEDADGKRMVIVTADLIGFSRPLRTAIEQAVAERYKLPAAALLLNASHTHCGPELRVEKVADAPSANEHARRAAAYTTALQEKIVALVGEAIGKLAPARLDYFHARCGFSMNRRRPTPKGFTNAPNPEGPVDQDVPLLRVCDKQGAIVALAFGYACHNTTLAYYKFCGDYAGFAKQYVEQAHPKTQAFFLTGCGADQNPYPRGTEELAQQHGRALANSVEAALMTVPRLLSGPLHLGWDEVTLHFAPPPTKEALEATAAGKKQPDAGHAARLLKQLKETGAIRSTYPYLVQVVGFGDDLTLVALSGEVVVDYSLRLKRELPGAPVWVAGYSNDVFGYVPSRRVLGEGGYEAGDAMRYGSLPGPFADDIEDTIVSTVLRLAKRK